MDDRLPDALARTTPNLRPDLLAVSFVRLATAAPVPWADMLRGEAALVVAQIIAFRLDDEVRRFDLANENGPAAAAAEIKNLAQQLDDWLTRIRQQLPAAFSDVLRALDQQMSLTARTKVLADASLAELTGVVRSRGFVTAADGNALTQARAIRAGLSAAHRQLVHAITSLKPAAQIAFDARIKAGTIEPAAGLILAELITAGVVDARLNDFTQRHTDFYYRDLIGQTPRGAAPERALLHLPSGAVPKLLREGTGMIARLENGKKVRFVTETDVPITPARITATAGLTYDTDTQVSLFSTLGAITGVRAAFEPAQSQPLNRSVFVAPAAPQVAMGLDIASDMFGLSEGHRRIDVTLYMQRATDLPAASPSGAPPPGSDPDPDIALELRSDPTLIRALGFQSTSEGIATLVAAVHAKAIERNCGPSMDLIYEVIASKILTVSPLRILLGRIMTLALVENHPWPTGAYWGALEARIIACERALTGQRDDAPPKPLAAGQTRVAGDIVEAFIREKSKDGEKGAFIYAPSDMFEKLLGDAFSVSLSTADGPLPAMVTQVMPIRASPDGPKSPAGFTIRLIYGADMPPITMPAEGTGTAPVLALRWNQQARVCPISFFERYTLDEIGIVVKVDGLRTLAGFSDDGAVAPAQAFQPFGARPTEGATFTVAAPEMARKPVTDVRLDLQWADLPDQPGGFAPHYAHYPEQTKVPAPKLTVDYLSGDGWKPVIETAIPMIDADPYDRHLLPHWHMAGPVQGGGVPASGHIPAKLPKSRAQLRAGAVRLTMTGAGDFGQAQYPLALIEAMRPRFIPLRPRHIPAAPYIPKLDSLQLGYTAAAIMSLEAPDSARPGDKVTQITPFGAREAFPHRILRNLGLFPPRLGLGTLYMQLSGAGALRQLGILFDIADSGHLRLVPAAVPLVWHYLTGDGWVALPATAISSDTTDGLLRSGVVTIDLPDDAATPDGEMPGGGVWVAVSAPWRGFETHPILTHVRTNGVWAISTQTNEVHAAAARDWRFEVASPGMSPPIEASRRAPPRRSEERGDYLARVSERLRHRQRAVTPYDVERLILEAFPDVWRVKCLPHLTRTSPLPQPGCTTVVVVRHPAAADAPQAAIGQERRFDAGTLEKIRAFLGKHGPENARYEVVNPAFDRLHVRAAIRFAPFLDDGAIASKLQRHLSSLLSVWTATDDLSRFGWSLNVPMLRAQIAALDDVIDVTDFSVLHFIADDTGSYRLCDTAQSDARGPLGSIIRPSRPWALALSTSDHSISAVERNQPITPTQSGIGRLRIGDMLIVGQEGRP
ncbi:hypothetical protein [Yoonia sp.]|uniref:hypothetical protein n=1 Tax=Yoonia sp. TaxID=2212373 RepID=UPI0025E82AF7|nr:hypothetical protein [Yoonia sp.]